MIYVVYVLAYLCVGWILSFLWVRVAGETKKITGGPSTAADVATLMILWPAAIFFLSIYIFGKTTAKGLMWILTLPLPKENKA